MYTVKIYNFDFSTQLTTLFHSYDFYSFKYSTEINKSGSCTFSINVRNTKAVAANFKMYNKIIVEKDGVGVFIGYVENLKVMVNTIEVFCMGILELFKKRIFSHNFTTGAGDTLQSAFFEILTLTNTDNDTGITVGVTDVSQAIANTNFIRSTTLDSWQKLANLASAEFEITPEKKLNFYYDLGEDKSASIVLQYKITQINSSNLRDFNVEVQGSDTANRIIGIANALTQTEEDATSIAEFGLLTDTFNFTQTADSGDLATETQNKLNNKKLEFYSPVVVVDEQKIDTDNLNLGDTIKVILDNGFLALNQNERIIKKDVTVSDNLKEEVKLNLMPTTGNLLPSSFIDAIIGMNKRINLLESTL